MAAILAPQTESAITFQRTIDFVLVKSIVTHPKVYRHLGDDFSPPPEKWEPNRHESVWYVLVLEGEAVLGVFMLVPLNTICYEIHAALLPVAWGEKGQRVAEGITVWVWANTPCRRLVGNVLPYNRAVLRFTQAMGMTVFGCNTRSYLKHGRLRDQIMLGISRPE